MTADWAVCPLDAESEHCSEVSTDQMFTTKIIRHYFRLTIHCYESQWWTAKRTEARAANQSSCWRNILGLFGNRRKCADYEILFFDNSLSQISMKDFSLELGPGFETGLKYNCYSVRVVWIKVNKVRFFLRSELQILTFALLSLNSVYSLSALSYYAKFNRYNLL